MNEITKFIIKEFDLKVLTNIAYESHNQLFGQCLAMDKDTYVVLDWYGDEVNTMYLWTSIVDQIVRKEISNEKRHKNY